MVFEELFRDLEKNKIQYLVVGGVAVVLHGFLRSTADLDLMVALNPPNLKAFLELMTQKGYKPKAPVRVMDFLSLKNRREWKRKKGMLVFSFYHPAKPPELIDVFVDEPIPFNRAFQQRESISIGKTTISVINVQDLITLKKKAGRPQDLEDIRALKKLKGIKKK